MRTIMTATLPQPTGGVIDDLEREDDQRGYEAEDLIRRSGAALSVNALGAAEDISDAIAAGLLLAGDIDQLARVGVTLQVTVEPGGMTANVGLGRRTAHLFSSLARHFNAPGVMYRQPGLAEAIGTMADGQITVRLSSPDAPHGLENAHAGREASDAQVPHARHAPRTLAEMRARINTEAGKACGSCGGTGGTTVDSSEDGVTRKTWYTCTACGGSGVAR